MRGGERPQALGTDSETGRDLLERRGAMYAIANTLLRKEQHLPYV